MPQLSQVIAGVAAQSGSLSMENGTGWCFQTTAPVFRSRRSMLRPLLGLGSGALPKRVLPVVTSKPLKAAGELQTPPPRVLVAEKLNPPFSFPVARSTATILPF